jgi:hypothetical protein
MPETLCEGLVMNKSTIIILSIFLVTGCATTNSNSRANGVNVSNMTQEQWNEIHIKNKSPVRLIKDQSNDMELIEVWAGIAGESGISQRYQTMAFNNIQQRCGYGQDKFIESRIVRSDDSAMEEVWLFNDPKSYREDRVSGMTIYLQYDPVTNYIQGELFGKCHSGRGTSLGLNN